MNPFYAFRKVYDRIDTIKTNRINIQYMIKKSQEKTYILIFNSK